MDMRDHPKKQEPWNDILRAVLAILFSTACFSALAASLVLTGILSQPQQAIWGSACAALACLMGSLIFLRRSKRPVLTAAISGAAFLLILIGAHMAFFPGPYQHVPMTALPAFLAAVLPAVFRQRTKGDRHWKK
jgi:membrane associated rhomboid family serine protease